jgi:large-conductance mechanosensitive channel
MTDKKPEPPEPQVTKVVTDGNTIRITQPAAKPGTPHHKQIIELVTPDEFVGGFIDFLREHAIVGLAIGFAIGAQAQSLVKTLLSSFIDPAFTLLFGEALSKRTFTWHFRSHHADFGWGSFVYGILNFLFVLAAIYVLVKVLKLDRLDKPKDKK